MQTQSCLMILATAHAHAAVLQGDSNLSPNSLKRQLKTHLFGQCRTTPGTAVTLLLFPGRYAGVSIFTYLLFQGFKDFEHLCK